MTDRESLYTLLRRESEKAWKEQERVLLLRVDRTTANMEFNKAGRYSCVLGDTGERTPARLAIVVHTVTHEDIPVEIVDSDEQVFEFVTEPYVLSNLRYWSAMPNLVKVSIPSGMYPGLRKCLKRRAGKLWFENLEVEILTTVRWKWDSFESRPRIQYTYLN